MLCVGTVQVAKKRRWGGGAKKGRDCRKTTQTRETKGVLLRLDSRVICYVETLLPLCLDGLKRVIWVLKYRCQAQNQNVKM